MSNSQINENLTLDVQSDVTVRLLDASGAVKSEFTKRNLVVTTGKEYIASRMHAAVNGGVGDVTAIRVGTGTTIPNATDLALQTEVASMAFASAPTRAGRTVTFRSVFLPGTPAASPSPITEAGIFNATGLMLNRVVFPVVNKETNDTLEIIWAITIN